LKKSLGQLCFQSKRRTTYQGVTTIIFAETVEEEERSVEVRAERN
jgi:hypothetical protein